jgi:hypothetical protein
VTRDRLIRLNLGNGEYIENEVPPPEVFAALMRLDRARKAKRIPPTRQDRQDLKTLFAWLNDQSDKYGDIKREDGSVA